MDPSLRDHWDSAYERLGEAASWYQAEPGTSIEMIEELHLPPDSAVLDVGGGSSALAGRLVDRGFTDVWVLDISHTALAASATRNGQGLTLLCEDVLDWKPRKLFCLWHDRAVLHFLTDSDDRSRYLSVMRKAVRPGGGVVIAAFASDGPEYCSGLPVMRYDAKAIGELLGDDFTVGSERRELHTTPVGVVQPFTWVSATRTNAA
jgi:SAM-dependent methyltransferase